MVNYTPLPTSCNVSLAALEDCLVRMGIPAQITLHVSNIERVYVERVLKEINAISKDNPFAPYVNLVVDSAMQPYEWYLEMGELRIGCKGP